MKKIILFLTTIFLVQAFSYAQSNQVTLRIILYPIQILEVNTQQAINFVSDKAEDLNQLIVHEKASTYSTSDFALKVNYVKDYGGSLFHKQNIKDYLFNNLPLRSLNPFSSLFTPEPILKNKPHSVHQSPRSRDSDGAVDERHNESIFEDLVLYSIEAL